MASAQPGGGASAAGSDAAGADTGPEAVADLIADELDRLGGPARQRLAEVLHQLGAIDRAVYAAVASVPAPALDAAMRRLSNAADHSRLWLAIAGAIALSGRRRPDRAGAGVPGARHVPMPSSTSFPSGHSAAAFAFATAISRDMPWLAVAIWFLAGSVAYSRVHTGVHYPGDTVVGALIGAGAGQAVSSVADRAFSRASVPPGRHRGGFRG